MAPQPHLLALPVGLSGCPAISPLQEEETSRVIQARGFCILPFILRYHTLHSRTWPGLTLQPGPPWRCLNLSQTSLKTKLRPVLFTRVQEAQGKPVRGLVDACLFPGVVEGPVWLGKPLIPPEVPAWTHCSVTGRDSHLSPPGSPSGRGPGAESGKELTEAAVGPHPHPRPPPIPCWGPVTHNVRETHFFPVRGFHSPGVSSSMAAPPTVSRALSLWPKMASLRLPGSLCSAIWLVLSTKDEGQGTEFSGRPGAVSCVGEVGGAL